MPFHRRMGSSLRPVNRIKHVFDVQAGVVLGTQLNTTIAASTDTPTQAVTSSVETAAKVNGFYIKAEVSATSGTALANVYFILFKNVGGNFSTPVGNAVGTSDVKRYVIHQEMIMLQKFDADVSANPRVLFNGVIAVPRGYRRMGPNDIWQLGVFSPGANLDLCIQVHYKEFR